MRHLVFLVPLWAGIVLNVLLAAINLSLIGHDGRWVRRWIRYQSWLLGLAWAICLGWFLCHLESIMSLSPDPREFGARALIAAGKESAPQSMMSDSSPTGFLDPSKRTQ